MSFLAFSAKAQQNSTAKKPEVKAEKILTATDVKLPVVSPATDEMALHNTATKISSAGAEAKLVKAVENKTPVVQSPPVQQLPQTDKLGLPAKSNN